MLLINRQLNSTYDVILIKFTFIENAPKVTGRACLPYAWGTTNCSHRRSRALPAAWDLGPDAIEGGNQTWPNPAGKCHMTPGWGAHPSRSGCLGNFGLPLSSEWGRYLPKWGASLPGTTPGLDGRSSRSHPTSFLPPPLPAGPGHPARKGWAMPRAHLVKRTEAAVCGHRLSVWLGKAFPCGRARPPWLWFKDPPRVAGAPC